MNIGDFFRKLFGFFKAAEPVAVEVGTIAATLDPELAPVIGVASVVIPQVINAVTTAEGTVTDEVK